MYTKVLSILVLCFLVKNTDGIFLGKDDRMPYQASLRLYNNNDHHCSGSIIGSKYILTAGHCVCVSVKFYMLYVVLGSDTYTSGGDTYEIVKSVCHENFNIFHLRNDIALLKTLTKIIYSNKVRPIPLIESKLPVNAVLTLPVWRYKKHVIPPLSYQIRQGNLIDTKYCASVFSANMVQDSNFCTFTKGFGACVGDSGGPVIYKGFLAGIISFGKNCLLQYPNVHTNISYYYEWITEKLFFESELLEYL